LKDKKKKNSYVKLNTTLMDIWYDNFMEILSEKYPKKSELAEVLMDLLSIERESAYRRLRKEIMFNTHEFFKIASAWNISLDEMIGVNSQKVTFQMHPMNYLEPSGDDMKFVRKRIDGLRQLKDFPNSEYVVVTNNMSRALSAGFANLYRFSILKWSYLYTDEKHILPYSQIIVTEKLFKEVSDYSQLMKDVGNTCYILDGAIFENIVQDIRFFQSIFFVSDEEKELIKQDLCALLDYLLEIANKGCFPETRNKVQIFVSVLDINTNYSYFFDGIEESARIHAFNMYDNICCNPKLIEKFKTWLYRTKKISTQISEADERSRIEFFRKQRELIDGL
jgi:hypothetical protein